MNASDSLDQLLSSSTVADGTFTFAVPPGFGQGRATFGGLVLGAVVRAMAGVCADDARRLRSLHAQLIGAPAVGVTSITARVLKATSSVTTVVAELCQAGVPQTHAVAVFAKSRPVQQQWQLLAMPSAPPWADVEPANLDNPFAPEFTRNFEFRPVSGWPFSGAEARTLGYVRPLVRCNVRDDAWLTALIDAWWLAAFVSFEAPRPAATLTFAAEYHGSAQDLDLDAPLLHRGDAIVLSDGYATETRELWATNGRLLATNRQIVAVIK